MTPRIPPMDDEARERSERLREAVEKAVRAYEALSPEQKAEHDRAQRESFIRGMGPCEHGDYDWETCAQCLAGMKERRK